MLENATVVATLPAFDLARAKAWYLEKMDLKPVEESGDGSWFETGGTRFLLYESQFAGTNEATAAGFQLDDFDGTIAELRGRGVTLEDYDFGDDFKTVDGVLTSPEGAKAAWIKDSEGNIIAITTAGT